MSEGHISFIFYHIKHCIHNLQIQPGSNPFISTLNPASFNVKDFQEKGRGRGTDLFLHLSVKLEPQYVYVIIPTALNRVSFVENVHGAAAFTKLRPHHHKPPGMKAASEEDDSCSLAD